MSRWGKYRYEDLVQNIVCTAVPIRKGTVYHLVSLGFQTLPGNYPMVHYIVEKRKNVEIKE